VKKKFSWSLDVSTTNVGMALWDENSKLMELRHLTLKNNKDVPEEVRYLDKAKVFKEYVKKFKEEVEELYDCVIENIFVEAPLMNTPVNIETTAKLLAFNGIVCYILDEVFGRSPFLISVYQSRKLFCSELVKLKNGKETLSFPKDVDKKYYIWEKVSKLEPQVEWMYKKTGEIKETSFDMSDAYAVGFAGLRVLGLK
jgi:Fe-S cluster biosynthesis and repair protein YggX